MSNILYLSQDNLGEDTRGNTMNSEMQEIEVTIEETKAQILRGERVKRLRENEDFKALILEGYFKEEAARLVLLKADPEMVDEKNDRASKIEKSLIGISEFNAYLNTQVILGNQAELALEAHLREQGLMREEQV